MDRLYYFRQFLNHFWLRPENALLLALRAESFKKTFNFFDDAEASIDVSCGDGVFSFIANGGQISADSDMFRSLRFGKREGDFDAFDCFDDTYKMNVIKEADRKFKYGIDWKSSLLAKASKLNFYQNTLVHDNNNKLPFEDESFQYVYTNSAYWVAKFEEHIKDLFRITASHGHIVLQIKTNNILQLSSRYYAPFMGEKFHTIIDAGRMSTWKGLRSKEDILNMIISFGNVDILSVEPIYGGLLARIWDIGLRPLFNPLARMANSLSDEERVSIKKEWNEILFDLFEESLQKYKSSENDAIEYLIVLEKK
ncbi:hypothetical protein PACILC2_13920 [Paenibacillus cisolokensis]|jgi:Methylase involved in ubiquinone/menaquinone biosynthesis|uniref:Methyltransferase type 11 domain-containing protein n=1 Tax=Paenibacillus cisolokensis TaxID=1658519 RepID=A0ABQ4N3T7_9BACL|nr:methyltransferase domain-containing protein [Paenibacillus cisolokensis]GIQ62824.1 hypothetical protein PACILC2_13920 [Paenibacillus cisolokensis]